MKKLVGLLLLALAGGSAFASLTDDQVYQLNNKMGPIPYSIQLGTLLKNVETVANSDLDEGNIWIGDSNDSAAALDISGDGKILIGDGTTAASVAVSGDITITNAGVTAIGTKKVEDQMLDLTQGSIVIGVTGGTGGELDVKGDGKIIVGNGTTATSVAVSGDVTLANDGAVTIGAGKVLETMLQAQTTDNALSVRRIAKAVFDPSTDAGSRTIAAHGLGVTLPDNAIVTGAWYDVITTFTSGTDAATLAISVEGANDLVSAIAIDNGGNPWDAGIFETIPKVETSSTFVKLTAARELTITVAVEALTAGKLVLFVEYMVSE